MWLNYVEAPNFIQLKTCTVREVSSRVSQRFSTFLKFPLLLLLLLQVYSHTCTIQTEHISDNILEGKNINILWELGSEDMLETSILS